MPSRPFALGFLEEFDAECLPVAAEPDELVFGQDSFEAFFALRERQPAKILSILKHQVEGEVLQFGFMAKGVL